jgi:hypothetical protein
LSRDANACYIYIGSSYTGNNSADGLCGNRKSRNIENNCPIHEYYLHLRNRHHNGVTTTPATNGYIFLKHNLKTRGEIEINLTYP